MTLVIVGRLLIVAAALSLLGCSSDSGGGDWVAMFGAVRNSWVNRDAAVSLSEAAAVPYATMGVRLGDSSEQVIVLATDSEGQRLWTSAARIAITTNRGRIVNTAGFEANLSGYQSGDGRSDSWLEPHRADWSADFADLGVYSVPISCRDTPAGREPTTILGKIFDTVRVDELCRSEALNWSFNNTYWVSEKTGVVWRSIQFVHPKMDPIQVEILRPPVERN